MKGGGNKREGEGSRRSLRGRRDTSFTLFGGQDAAEGTERLPRVLPPLQGRLWGGGTQGQVRGTAPPSGHQDRSSVSLSHLVLHHVGLEQVHLLLQLPEALVQVPGRQDGGCGRSQSTPPPPPDPPLSPVLHAEGVHVDDASVPVAQQVVELHVEPVGLVPEDVPLRLHVRKLVHRRPQVKLRLLQLLGATHLSRGQRLHAPQTQATPT